MVRIRVWRDGDPPLTVRPTAGFDPGPLPPDAFAFALARAVDGLLQQAEVVPREGQTRSTSVRSIDFPTDAIEHEMPRPTGESEMPAPVTEMRAPVPESAPEPASASAWEVSIGIGAAARWFSTDEGHLGGLLAVGVRHQTFWVVGELHVSAGLSRESALGVVSSSLWGGAMSALWRESLGGFSVGLGPSVSLFAARFSAEANVGTTLASDAWRPVFLGGGRLQIAWSLAPALVWTGLEASAVIVGAEGADDVGGVSRLSGFVASALLGVGLELR